MRPAARIAAAIEVLDAILSGAPAEQALVRWSRAARYAGSKDRAAVRDHVFDALRNLSHFAALGGADYRAPTGRAVMIGALRVQGQDPAEVFSGDAYAPQPLSTAEATTRDVPENALWNLPEWLIGAFKTQLPESGFEQAGALAQRAPISLRANLAKTTRADLSKDLAQHGIVARDNPLASTALTLDKPVRGLQDLDVFRSGHFELQDASSQAVTEVLEVGETTSILDFCAGGGGKSLALAHRTQAPVYAHDAYPNRMKDLPERARRAGVKIKICRNLTTLSRAKFDLVLVDAPCSGSGSWRRDPEGKWLLTPEEFSRTLDLQAMILQQASAFVAPDGVLAYATCSILSKENRAQVDDFTKAFPDWEICSEHNWTVSEHGDGFYLCQLRRSASVRHAT